MKIPFHCPRRTSCPSPQTSDRKCLARTLSAVQIYGSGRTGGPDTLGANNFTQGSATSLTTTNPTTSLYNPALTWQDSSDAEVTYSATVKGGLDEVAADGSIVFKGQITASHDAVNPGDSIWYGTAGIRSGLTAICSVGT